MGENHRVGALYVGVGGASTDLLLQHEAASKEHAARKRSVRRFMKKIGKIFVVCEWAAQSRATTVLEKTSEPTRQCKAKSRGVSRKLGKFCQICHF